MNSIITGLQNIIERYTSLLKQLTESSFRAKPLPGKWSKIEELGHLIDSAQNNIRRFIVAQYEDQPHIAYRQDKWVAISNYQDYPIADLVELWVLINRHLCIILKNTSPEKAGRPVMTQRVHSIEWLAGDYNKHLLHHLHHLLELEPIPYP